MTWDLFDDFTHVRGPNVQTKHDSVNEMEEKADLVPTGCESEPAGIYEVLNQLCFEEFEFVAVGDRVREAAALTLLHTA